MTTPTQGNNVPALCLERVTKKFGSTYAVRDVTLDIAPGEFVTLLGPSGSGKTTLLNIVAGMTEPSDGAVLLSGHDVSHIPANQRGLGMVFQNYALLPHMTVFDNVAFPLKVRRLRKTEIQERVTQALRNVHLQEMMHRKPKELSGGQQQRVSLARSLVYEPPIILMDEPLGALDRNLREQMQLEIRRLHTELGITILFVTHDQEEALTMSDRIILMRDGKIEQQGTPSDLYFRPRTLFAARFLGDSNILPGTVSAIDNGHAATITMQGGAILNSCPIDNAKIGDELQVVVRPENVRIIDQSHEGADKKDFRLRGTTIDSIFLAGIIKTFIRLETGETFVSQRLTHHKATVPINGSSVEIAWASDDTMLLPAGNQPESVQI